MESSTPEGFDAFYDLFHTDSTYQMEHILFPLKAKQDLSTWNKDEWVIHKNPLTDTLNISRQIRTLSGLVLEVVYHNQGFFLLERRFMPIGDQEWQMIYYTQRTNLQDWEKIYEESGIEIKTVPESQN